MTRDSFIPRHGAAYVVFVIVAGLTVIGVSAVKVAATMIGLQFFMLAALTLLSGSATVRLPSVPATISISETFVFTSVLLFGPAAGATIVALDGLIISVWLAKRRLVLPSGEPLNRMAWEANFTERGLLVPPGGPRDGYWGARMPPQVKDPDIGWFEAEAPLPGLVEEDAAGLQRMGPPDVPRHLLILGGSVARLGEWLFGPVRAAVRERCRAIPVEQVRIAPAALGGDAGAIGAAIWAFQRMENQEPRSA